MIFDKIKNKKLYFGGDIFDEIFNQLEEYSVKTPNGVYKNHSLFYFKIMDYDTQEFPNVTESHRKEVDVQIILLGEEKIKIYNSDSVEIKQAYNDAIDCEFYNPIKEPISELILKPGFMAVFFPDDIHQPQFQVTENKINLKKIVIKIDATVFS